jgi:non-homologous end joining protein Ku
VLETIQRKVEGQDITTDVTPDNAGGKVIDLMEALKASLVSHAPKDVAAARMVS